MRLDEVIEKHKDLISEIEVVSPIIQDRNYSRITWHRFEIFYYGNMVEYCPVISDPIIKYKDEYKEAKRPIKIFGVPIWHKKKTIKKRMVLLSEEQFQEKIKEDFIKMKAIRDSLVCLTTPFLKDKPLTNFQKYGRCLEPEHAWGPWADYSGHKQRKCYKCKEVEAIGFVDGKPVSQAYAESLSCGY